MAKALDDPRRGALVSVEPRPGHLVVTHETDSNGNPITIVSGYTNSVAGADIVVHLLGTVNLTAGDFILSEPRRSY